MPGRLLSLAGCALLCLAASGCASDYVARTRGIRDAYERDDTPRALERLKVEEQKAPKIDRLLVLLDQGMVLHAAGRFEESIKVLAEADRLSQELDVVSISETVGTLLTNEREKSYQGEDFEKLMISVLQALNYALLGKDDDALVEIRRVNERIKKMVDEEKKPYEQLAIARYLGGVLYEDSGNEDSAFIDYYEAYKLNPQLRALAAPLVRLAKRTGRDDLYLELSARFPDLDPRPIGPGDAQLVVVVETGLAPEKVQEVRNTNHAGDLITNVVPRYRDRWRSETARVAVGGKEHAAVTVTSLEEVAKVHLDDRVGKMILKSLAGTAVKAGLAAGAGALTKSKEVGAISFLLLSLFNQADLRSWLSLPAEFQVARFRLQPGKHTVTITAGGKSLQREVELKAKRVSLLPVRVY
jgi:uncharacterized protein